MSTTPSLTPVQDANRASHRLAALATVNLWLTNRAHPATSSCASTTAAIGVSRRRPSRL